MANVSSALYPDIIDSIDKNLLNEQEFMNPTIRYYEHKYCKKLPSIDEELYQRVSFHSNRICLLSLADNHPIIKENKDISKINCQVSNVDRLKNTVSGKGKRGAQKLQPTSEICYIECKDGSKYPVYTCIEGKLIEINKKLLDNPELLKTHSTSIGYIALVLPVLDSYQNFKGKMLTKDEYEYNKFVVG